MVDNHFEVDEGAGKPPRELMDSMRDLRKGWSRIQGVRASMIRMKDTDAQNDEVFAQVATQYAYQGDDAAAKKSNARKGFEEIDGSWDTVNNKIEQMLASFL